MGFLFIGLLGWEIYLRYTACYIVSKNKKSDHILFVKNSPEIFIRYTSKGKRLIPNAHAVIKNHYLSKRNIQMDINSMGFRDNEISLTKKENELRILVLGDSITWGDYLDAHEVYVERSEYYLNKLYENRHIEVINAGVGDIGLQEQIDILVEKGLSIFPDIVVIAFYLNDSRPPWGFSGELSHRNWLQKHSFLADKIYYTLKLKKWIKAKGENRFKWIYEQNKLDWMQNPQDFYKLAKLAKYDWGAAWYSGSWNTVQDHFKNLNLLSEKYHFQAVILVLPVAFQVYANFNENYPQQTLLKIARKHNYPYLDLLPILRKHNHLNLFFDHCHPRIVANDIIGKTIADFMNKEVLLH